MFDTRYLLKQKIKQIKKKYNNPKINWEKEIEKILDKFEIKLKKTSNNMYKKNSYSNSKKILMAHIYQLLKLKKKEWQEEIKEKIEIGVETFIEDWQGGTSVSGPKILERIFYLLEDEE